MNFSPDEAQFNPRTASHADCEKHIIRWLVAAALCRGLSVSVNDGGQWVVRGSRDIVEIMEALRSTGQDHLLIRDHDAGRKVGVVTLIYGNAPWEVISDYTDTEEMGELIKHAEAVAKLIEEARSMKSYRVEWVTDVEAPDPTSAAEIAWLSMRAKGSIANVFDVFEIDPETNQDHGEPIRVDLQEIIEARLAK